jgi:hypothetical protein
MRRIRGPGASLQSPRGYAPARRQHGAAIPYACRNVRPPRGRLDAAEHYHQRGFALRPDVAEVNNNSASCLRHAASSRRRSALSAGVGTEAGPHRPLRQSRAGVCSCRWDRQATPSTRCDARWRSARRRQARRSSFSARVGGFRGPAVVVNTGVGAEPRSAPASSRATARSWPW